MQFELSDELAEYRRAVRAHIASAHPDLPRLPGTRSPGRADLPAYRSWCAGLFAAGLIGADWPVEWGGQRIDDPLRDFVLDAELAEAQLPRPSGAWGLIGAALLRYGTDGQRAHYLPRIRRYDDIWCQLFSEPEAGSDLAALRTTARRDGDGWLVNGQKVWTTHAHVADLGFLLARTDPEVAKQAGISAFVLDMRAPGLTIRPLREITGSSDFSEVFFDDVRVPDEAIIGAPGQGWEIARAALARERSHSVREDPVAEKVRRLAELAGGAQQGQAPRDVRRELGRLYARAQATDLLGFEGTLREIAHQERPFDAPAAKILFSETNLATVTYALDLLGDAVLGADEGSATVDDGYWQTAFLFARGYTISAGSNEIMRNVIAERGLGLPR